MIDADSSVVVAVRRGRAGALSGAPSDGGSGQHAADQSAARSQSSNLQGDHDGHNRRTVRQARARPRPARRATTWMHTTVRRSGRPRPRPPSSPRRHRRREPLTLAASWSDQPAHRRTRWAAAAPVPAAPAVGARRARPDAQGRAAVVRRGIEGALRRGRADAIPSRTSRRSSTGSRSGFPAAGRSSTATTRSAARSSSRATKLDAVFQTAIAGVPRADAASTSRCPAGEQFTVEYVTNKSWSGYNWYQGSFRSLIQVNTDLPIYIDRAVDLACHEGYPGPSRLQRAAREAPGADRGWVEFTVYPLFSPQSLIAEGTANFGIEVAFPGQRARRRSSATCSFPRPDSTRRGPPSTTRCRRSSISSSYAGNEAARRYLERRDRSRAQAAAWLERYALMPHDRARAARALLRPVPQLRDQLQPRQGPGPPLHRVARRHAAITRSQRWQEFEKLLSSPRLPSGLQ